MSNQKTVCLASRETHDEEELTLSGWSLYPLHFVVVFQLVLFFLHRAQLPAACFIKMIGYHIKSIKTDHKNSQVFSNVLSNSQVQYSLH